MPRWTTRAAFAASLALAAAFAATARAADTSPDVQSELSALKTRIAELEAKQNENWLTEARASEIRAIVNDVLADARNHGQFLDSDYQAGYKDGAPFSGTNNANGIDIRRARISFSGNIFDPNLFFKFEGDFYGGSNLTSATLTTSSTPN